MRRLPMPNTPGIPTARAASSSMWMSMNSSFTAAKRFQLARPVVRTYAGIPDMTGTLEEGPRRASAREERRHGEGHDSRRRVLDRPLVRSAHVEVGPHDGVGGEGRIRTRVVRRERALRDPVSEDPVQRFDELEAGRAVGPVRERPGGG